LAVRENPVRIADRSGRIVLKRISELWLGEVPLARVYWDYAMIAGTILNLVTTGASLAAFALGWPGWLALAIFFLPLPYNILMVVSVWRSAARYDGAPRWAALARATIIPWALFVTLI
jgi:hypothetical protein